MAGAYLAAMPEAPVPQSFVELLARPNPAVLSFVRFDGTPGSCAIWYGWRDGRVLLTFDKKRKRLDFIRADPAVSVTVLDGRSWYRHLVLNGRVAELFDDEGLRRADELAQAYIGGPYPQRDAPRIYGWMHVDSWFYWDAHAEVGNLQIRDTTQPSTRR